MQGQGEVAREITKIIECVDMDRTRGLGLLRMKR